jgi:hypothetical protein
MEAIPVTPLMREANRKLQKAYGVLGAMLLPEVLPLVSLVVIFIMLEHYQCEKSQYWVKLHLRVRLRDWKVFTLSMVHVCHHFLQSHIL